MRIKTFISVSLLFILLALFSKVAVEQSAAQQQSNSSTGTIWTDVDESNMRVSGDRVILPTTYRVVSLDADELNALLIQTPLEGTQAARNRDVILDLPTPTGGYSQFRIVESPIMAPELAAKFPGIKTYAGQGIDDPAATLRFDVTPHGFHAQVLSPLGRWYIDPYFHLNPESDLYISYYSKDITAEERQFFESSAPDLPENLSKLPSSPQLGPSGDQLRVHRLAQAATGEYTQFFGGTVEQGMAAITTAINRVTGIFEVEVSVRLQLVANNDLIVYTDGGTDPYPGADINVTNQTTIDSIIGDANYDIGHVFSTGSGGYVSGYMGVTGDKAKGNTGSNPPTGDAFWVDYVAH